MEKKKIHTTEDVEKVVNDPERQEAIRALHKKQRAKKKRKMLLDALAYLALAVVIGALGNVGWMLKRLAYSLCAVAGLYSAFKFGRWFEVCKRCGWR